MPHAIVVRGMCPRSWNWRPAWSFRSRNFLLYAATSADGSLVACVDSDLELCAFNRAGELMWKFFQPELAGTRHLRELEVSKSGNTVAAIDSMYTHKLYVLHRDGSPLWHRGLDSEWVAVRISQDDSRICLTDGGTISMYNRSGEHLWTHHIKGSRLSLAASTDLRTVAWTGGRKAYLCGPDGEISGEVAAGDSLFFEMSADGKLLVMDVSRTKLVAFDNTLAPVWEYSSKASIFPVALSRDASLIAAGSRDGRLIALNGTGERLWEHRDRKHYQSPSELGFVWPIGVAANGSIVVAGWGERILRAFDKQGRALWGHLANDRISEDEGFEIEISIDGSLVVAGFNDGNFVVFDRRGKPLLTERAGPYIHAPAIAEDGSLIAVILDERNLSVFKSAEGE